MERKASPRDAVEYRPVVAFVSTGDPLFTLGYSRPIYEQLVAPHKRMIDDVLLHRGRTSPQTTEVRPQWFGGRSSPRRECTSPTRTARPQTTGHRQSALGDPREPVSLRAS